MEPKEVLNKRLLELYGRFSHTDLPNYRVSWSTDSREKIWTNRTKEGFQLQDYQVLEKYKYPLQEDRWVLEKCFDVPEGSSELVEKFSYEPIWFFEDVLNRPVEPTWEGIQIIIDTIHKQMARAGKGDKRYTDSAEGLYTSADQAEYERQRLDKIQEELFGNESDIATALAWKEGIVKP